MAITKDDFEKIWASTSPLTPYAFSDAKYKEGWNFIGSTPPSRQMWDFLQKNNDKKMQYLLTHFDNYLPLSGGTLTGDVDITGDLSVSGAITGSIQYVNNGKVFTIGNTVTGNVNLGWNWDNREGAGLGLRSADYSTPGGSHPGEFMLFARDANNSCSLEGKPDGSLTWGNKEVERVTAKGSNYIRYESGLQLCWGWVSINVNSAATSTTPFAYRGVVTITFPVAFNGTPFGVSNVDDGSPWWTTTAREITSTTMQVEASGNTTATKGVCWFAVGNWK